MKILRKLKMILLPKGTHFKVGDLIKLKETFELKELLYVFARDVHEIESVQWTNNINYCDQFLKIKGIRGQYYNTNFELA